MSGELQPFGTERYVEKLSRIIGELGGIAARVPGLGTEVKNLTSEAKVALEILSCIGCSDCEEALSDEDAESGWEMESLLADMEYMEYMGYREY